MSDTREQQKCQEMMSRMDAYLDDSILTDSRRDLLAHVEQCQVCTQELAVRTSLRSRVKTAVQSVQAPAFLEARIRANLDVPRQGFPWRMTAPVAGAAVLCLGAVLSYQSGRFRLTRNSQDSYITSVSTRVATLMRVGLGDHIHCAVFRKYPKNPPSMEHFISDMGPQYSPIIPIVRDRVPGDLVLQQAHQCSYHSRPFVHMVLKNDSTLLSIVITRKAKGEALRSEELVPALSESGISFYNSNTQRFQISAFESRDYVVYVISDLSAQRNLELMRAMAPSLSAYLGKLES